MSIGASVPRDRAKRLLLGRGNYVDDISLPRMLHLALVRSPYAHAHVGAIETREALALPGVIAVFTAEDLEGAVSSWRAEHKLFPAMAAPEQFALARDVVRWQGEAVAAVLDRRDHVLSRTFHPLQLGLLEPLST